MCTLTAADIQWLGSDGYRNVHGHKIERNVHGHKIKRNVHGHKIETDKGYEQDRMCAQTLTWYETEQVCPHEGPSHQATSTQLQDKKIMRWYIYGAAEMMDLWFIEDEALDAEEEENNKTLPTWLELWPRRSSAVKTISQNWRKRTWPTKICPITKVKKR